MPSSDFRTIPYQAATSHPVEPGSLPTRTRSGTGPMPLPAPNTPTTHLGLPQDTGLPTVPPRAGPSSAGPLQGAGPLPSVGPLQGAWPLPEVGSPSAGPLSERVLAKVLRTNDGQDLGQKSSRFASEAPRASPQPATTSSPSPKSVGVQPAVPMRPVRHSVDMYKPKPKVNASGALSRQEAARDIDATF